MGRGLDVERAVGDDGRRIDRISHVDLREQLLFFARGKYGKRAILGADVNFAVGVKRRTPDVRVEVVDPVNLAGLGVEAMEVAGKIADEQQPVRRDRAGGKAAVDFVV